MAAKKSPFFDTATTLGKIVAFFGISALCGVLAAGMLVPVAAIAKTGLTTGNNIVSALPSTFEKLPIPEPSQVLDSDGKLIATFYEQNRDPVDLKDISPFMRKAIVSVEDERFYEHSGIDPKGIARAVISNATSSSRSGASTLTQQYVNNLLVNNQILTGADETTVSGNKDYSDKIRELKYAVAIEKEMSKDEILEGYLNLVLFSGREYGVQAAAQRFFSVDAKDLNLQQSAMLAGMVQLPNVYNPIKNPERSLDRRNKVLGNMYRTGAVTKKEYDKAVKSKLGVDPSSSASGCMAADDAGYFCDYITNLVLKDKNFGKTKEDRENLLFRGGLVIKTTLNSALNKKAAKDAREAIDPDAKSNKDIHSSLVSIEPGTGNILTMAQNTTYAPKSEETGSRTFYNFAVERALGGAGGFQGGSTMKPYTTLAWLHEGNHMYDKINAKKETFRPGDKWRASCLPGGTATVGSSWTPKNASRGFYRTMTVDTGLYWSINSATIQEANKVDLCTIADYTKKLGLLDQDADDGKPAPISPANPAFIIGSANITPMAQAAAFATFANKGEYCAPRAITSVVDKDGTKYKVPKQDCSQQIDPQYVADLNGTLKKIATNRVSKGQVAGPIAGKTGTNDYATSTWFVGYSTGISTAAWVGRLDGKAATKQNSLHGAMINDERAPEMVDSSTYAAPLWVDFMSKAVQQYERDSFGSVSKAPKPKPKPKEDDEDKKEDSKKEDSKKEDSEKEDSKESEDDKSEATGNGNGNGNGNGQNKSKPTTPAKPGGDSDD
ncbi:penicillin-binding protein [Arthrobacter sp. MYb211]|uniref:transglycosylase domain-containing protein n=1 Tax=unclassified Arthrobacter TaxID=235627 RepID=UPI000CFB3DB6|nr:MULTISPECIES: transglycosylase domain-containing protein [unclassified Arthrobacter]PRA11279.1 penicillin-binding protein [Arthrobacter sp. MYb221]PRC07547.1 penicillin-binding protein [Arthrobacter sp. MYb211]